MIVEKETVTSVDMSQSLTTAEAFENPALCLIPIYFSMLAPTDFTGDLLKT